MPGPDGGTEDKPVGTVWFAWCDRAGRVTSCTEEFAGSRDEVRRQTVALALAGPLSKLELILRPIVRALVWFADIQMPGKGVTTSPTVTEDELRRLASRAAKEGEITPEDLGLIERAFRLGDRRRAVRRRRPDAGSPEFH